MTVLKLHIVGFPYRTDLEGCVSEFLADAPGHAMTIRPQHGNDHDKTAIRAYDWKGRFVGFVSQKDLPIAWGALRDSGKESLRGMIVSTNIEHPCALFECMVPEYNGPATDLYSQKPFLNWKYSGPILNQPDELDNLDFMRDEIRDRLQEKADWSEDDMQDFVELVRRFTVNSKYDISGEMNDYRKNLIQRLRDTDFEELEEVTEELEMSFGRTGREVMGGKVLDFWMKQIRSQESIKYLMVHSREYDANVIESELEQFPESMYYEWKENRDKFISKVLYLHIPREVLWRFVSGIAFVEIVKGKSRGDQPIKISELVDSAVTMGVESMKEAELLISRLNDNCGHIYDGELNRLRGALNEKIAKEAEPRKIGQLIDKQLNLGDLSGFKALFENEDLKKYLTKE